jgi:PAS domain S-box-containing protein
MMGGQCQNYFVHGQKHVESDVDRIAQAADSGLEMDVPKPLSAAPFPPSMPPSVESYPLMAAAFDQVAMAVVAWDGKGTIVLMNRAAERLFGYRVAEVLGRMHSSELFEPAELSALAADLSITLHRQIEEQEALVIHSQSARHYGRAREWTMRRRDGARFPATVSLSELSSSKSGFDGTLAAITNISARKRTAEAFLAKQRQLEEFIHHTPAAVALLDSELCYLATSHRWVVDYALPDQDLRGRSHLELFPNLPRHWRDAYLRCLGGAIERRDEDRFVRPDGREEWLRWECHPWYRLDGEIGGITIFSEVITDKYLAQQKLRASEAQLSEAQHLARIGSWEFNLSTKHFIWSLETYRIHGLAPGIPVDSIKSLSFFVPEHRPIIEEAFERAIKEGLGWDYELQIDTVHGRRLWVRSVGKVDTFEGNSLRLFGTFQDISERKRWENEILHAKDEALAAARAKSDFLANMSHEIRTPLNAVIGMASLLLDSKLDEEQKDCANTIRTASESLLQIINQILDFSKIESGRIDLESQPFGLSECVETAVEIAAPIAIEKKLELHCWIDPRVPSVVIGDVTRLRQILVNLVSNAVKFTHDGEVEVLVRPVEPGDETYDPANPPDHSVDAPVEIEFSVRDTGIGIPPERMDRLFKSFSQVDSSTTRQYGGTGLGLAICRRLVELMDGRVWAESMPGVGSTFSFVLPCYVDAAPGPLPQSTSLKGKRILLLMPPGNGRRLLRAHLETWGAEAKMAETAVEALGYAHVQPRFDAMIIDSAMLENSPLAQHAKVLSLPIILLTPLGARLGALSQFEPAATLTKPLKPRLLQACLQRVLIEQPAPVAAAPASPGVAAPAMVHRLLLAEDNVVNQRVAISMLKRMGWEARLVSNGLEAVQALETEHLKFVLMDMQMPEMDGLVATQEIRRRLPIERQPVIIALTANALPGDRERCLSAGMDDYMSKPIHPEELRAKLEFWLGRISQLNGVDKTARS